MVLYIIFSIQPWLGGVAIRSNGSAHMVFAKTAWEEEIAKRLVLHWIRQSAHVEVMKW